MTKVPGKQNEGEYIVTKVFFKTREPELKGQDCNSVLQAVIGEMFVSVGTNPHEYHWNEMKFLLP